MLFKNKKRKWQRIITSLAVLDLSPLCVFTVKMGHSIPHVSHHVFTNLLIGVSVPLTYESIFCCGINHPPSFRWLVDGRLTSTCCLQHCSSICSTLALFFFSQYALTLTWEYRGSYRSHFLWMTLWDDLRWWTAGPADICLCHALLAFISFSSSFLKANRSIYVHIVYILPEK